jgi:hypothetical protein
VRRRAQVARAWWRADWAWRRRWHRYRVEGVESLLSPGSKLLVGYHGRPIAHDLCMLQEVLREEHGVASHAFVHAAAESLHGFRHLVEGVEFLVGDDARTQAAVDAGHLLIVTPGATREGCRPSSVKYKVDWGERNGFLKLAFKYRLPIVPAGGRGVDDTYIGLNDGYAWGKKLGVPEGLPAWVGVGPAGLWPLSPPFPVPITTRVGAPITDHLAPGFDPRDKAAVAALGAHVRAEVQALLDREAA